MPPPQLHAPSWSQISAGPDGERRLSAAKTLDEQWRFVDASGYPDYPAGYGKEADEADEDFDGATGDRPLKDGHLYFIVDDYDRPSRMTGGGRA